MAIAIRTMRERRQALVGGVEMSACDLVNEGVLVRDLFHLSHSILTAPPGSLNAAPPQLLREFDIAREALRRPQRSDGEHAFVTVAALVAGVAYRTHV